jgi:hypothetical protein
MSFFEENKNIGLLLLILGLATLIAAIVLVILATGKNAVFYSVTGAAVALVGSIICGLLYLLAGLSIRESADDKLGIFQLIAGIIGLKISYDNKIGVPAFVIMVMGAASLISGIFSIISYAAIGAGGMIASPAVSIILGIFFLIAAPIVAGNKKSSSGTLIWIILLILIILGVIFSFFALFLFGGIYGVMLIICGLCSLLLYIYLLLALLSPEIKRIIDVNT